AHPGEVMARDVTGQVPAVSVPATVGLGLGLEPGPFAIVREHPVGLELEQVARAELLRVLEGPTREPDGVERERSSLHDLGARRDSSTPEMRPAARTRLCVSRQV